MKDTTTRAHSCPSMTSMKDLAHLSFQHGDRMDRLHLVTLLHRCGALRLPRPSDEVQPWIKAALRRLSAPPSLASSAVPLLLPLSSWVLRAGAFFLQGDACFVSADYWESRSSAREAASVLWALARFGPPAAGKTTLNPNP